MEHLQTIRHAVAYVNCAMISNETEVEFWRDPKTSLSQTTTIRFKQGNMSEYRPRIRRGDTANVQFFVPIGDFLGVMLVFDGVFSEPIVQKDDGSLVGEFFAHGFRLG